MTKVLVKVAMVISLMVFMIGASCLDSENYIPFLIGTVCGLIGMIVNGMMLNSEFDANEEEICECFGYGIREAISGGKR